MSALIPNVIEYQSELWVSIFDTLYLIFWAGFYSFIFGLIIGVILVVTRKNGILPNRFVYKVLDIFVNIFRSIPYVILIVMLMGLTSIIMGTALGKRGALFPLIIGCIPFFSRQTELALMEVNPGLIEAAQSMGVSPLGIIFRVYLKEGIPSLVRGGTITLISLLGLTAMGGTVAGGGIGAFVINYGFKRNKVDITWVSVLIILIMVSIIQVIGDCIIKRTKH